MTEPNDSRLPVALGRATNTKRPKIPIVGLFAGIGGFELALADADLEAIVLAEIDPAAQAVLRTKFNGVEIVNDVQDIVELPEETQIVTAGFPCQNLSMAGDKSGIEGPKSVEVVKLFKILERSRVPTVVIENVYFMLHLDRGRAMTWLLGQVESLGYHWAYRVVDTSGFGLPHRRRRVYLVASRDLDPRTVLFADEVDSVDQPRPTVGRPLGFYWTEGRSGVGITVDGIPPLKSGSALGIPSTPAVLFPDNAVLTPSIGACEALQGFPTGWTDAARTEQRDPRWRLLGNAVSVPVAKWIGSRIREPGPVLDLETRPLEPGGRWPNAAFGLCGVRYAVDAGSKPLALQPPSIERYRDDTWTPLSDRALAGFLRRAGEGKLRFPEGFLEALQANLADTGRFQSQRDPEIAVDPVADLISVP